MKCYGIGGIGGFDEMYEVFVAPAYAFRKGDVVESENGSLFPVLAAITTDQEEMADFMSVISGGLINKVVRIYEKSQDFTEEVDDEGN